MITSEDLAIIEQITKSMKDNWKSGIVPQKKVSEFTGGLLASQTIVNLCSQGKGPSEKIYIRGKACYPVDSFCEWLLEGMTGTYKGFEIRKHAPNNRRKKKK